MDDILQKINNKEKEFADLYTRMDEDKKLLILDDYTMRDKDDREEPDVDNITMNDPGNFGDRVHNTLIKADIIPEVEGEGLKDEDTELIEKFIRDMEFEADAILQPQGFPTFRQWEAMQACDRGYVARRITLSIGEDGRLAPTSFKNVDTRYLIYDNGINGLRWVATRTPRSKADIEEEYPNANFLRASAIVTSHWDDEKESVFVGKNQVDEKENIWGEPPFVIQVMPTGTWTMDDDRMAVSGESIFARNRDLYEKKNWAASILATLNANVIFPKMQVEVEDALAMNKKPASPPWAKKVVLPYLKGTKGYSAIQFPDIHKAFSHFYSILDSALQEGALPKISYGDLQFPISAVGMAELKEAEDPVYFPRIQGLALFWQRCQRMIIKQYIAQRMHLKIGEEGFRKEYSYRDLQKECSIKYRFFISSPKQDMVNISTAAAVGGLVSDDTKRRDYLHIQNPTEEDNKIWAERAARMSPAVAMYDVIKALFARGEKVKANIMAEEMGMTLDQVIQGQVVQPGQSVPEEKPKQLMPLFRGTGGGAEPATVKPSVAGEDTGGE